MRTIHIGIGHDNDLVVTQFCNIEVFMDTRSESSDHGFDLGISIDFIQSRFLHVQNFSTQWKDCLCRTASCGLGRAAGGITLYDIDFTVFRIFIGTVCQFSRKGHSLQCGFSSGQITGFTGCLTGTLCQQGFLADGLCNSRILLQEISQLLTYYAVHCTTCFAVSKLLFCLSLKLRLRDFDTDDSSQTLTDIFTGKCCFIFLHQFVCLCIRVKCLCQGISETGQMRTTFRCRNIIYKTER